MPLVHSMYCCKRRSDEGEDCCDTERYLNACQCHLPELDLLHMPYAEIANAILNNFQKHVRFIIDEQTVEEC